VVEGKGVGIEALDYPVCPGVPPKPAWEVWPAEADENIAEDAAHDGAGGNRGKVAASAAQESRADLEARSFEAGRVRGREEGQRAERESEAAAQAAAEEGRKRQIAGLIRQFAEEGDRFLHTVEQEVVKLALAVAARILRREAQMDPLLLTGAVRVALGQLGASSEVKMRVPAAEVDLWKETVALVPKLAIKPVVAAGEGMRTGECVIESKIGTVDLGVRSQLGEIERGFFDRSGSGSRPAGGEDPGAAHAQEDGERVEGRR